MKLNVKITSADDGKVLADVPFELDENELDADRLYLGQANTLNEVEIPLDVWIK